MSRSSAYGTSRMLLVAATHATTEVNLFGLDPLCAIGLMTVNTLANGNSPFGLPFLKNGL